MSEVDVLTRNEYMVWQLRTAGLRNKDVAGRLGITKDHAAVIWSMARKRLAGLLPPAWRNCANRSERMEANAKRALARGREIVQEKRCDRCQLRGHAAGDPERCLPTARYFAERRLPL